MASLQAQVDSTQDSIPIPKPLVVPAIVPDSIVKMSYPAAGEVRVYSFSEGLSVLQFDEKDLARYQGASVGDLLQRESGLFVKQYGLGMSGTASNRGSGAAQTAVLWEGINILNPMLGQSDLSLLPVVFMDYISLRSGGSAALDGNNAIGGSIKLGSSTNFNSGWLAKGQLQFGSFGDMRQQLRLGFGNKNYAGSLRAFYQRAENNFCYRDNNAFGNPKPWVQQSNAKQESFGLMQENTFRLFKHQLASVKNWFQKSYRQIPPNLLQTTGDREEQKDLSFRNILQWSFFNDKQSSNWSLKNAFMYEELGYKSQVLESDSRMLSNTTIFSYVQKLPFLKLFDSNFFKVLAQHQYQSAVSSSYNKSRQQIRLSSVLVLEKDYWRLNLLAGAQWVDNKLLRPAFDVNGQFRLFKNSMYFDIFLQAAVSYNYRYPTLNDRFWQPGGNPDLLPEYAWNNDLMLRFEHLIHRRYTQVFSIGGFSNYVENWIQWSPQATTGLWQPQNIASVWARGSELSWDFHYKTKGRKPLRLHIGATYYLNIATRIKDSDPILQNKQLIYTPQHSVLGRFNLSYKNLELNYRHNFNSLRYLDNSNAEWIPAYQLGWLRISYALIMKRITLDFYASADNIWGSEYQVVANRAMPLQNLQIGMNFSFHKKIIKK